MKLRHLAVCLLLAWSGSGAQSAQPVTDDIILARADSLYFASELEQSVALCEREIAIGARAPLHWRVARADIAMGMVIPESPRRKELYDSALAHARRAAALAPDDLHARYWVAAAAGRRAHRDDPILSIRLAYEVYDQVTAILAADSLHPGAHHVLGLLNADVLRAPRFVRFVAARMLRLDLAKRASWDAAESHMRRAVELDAGMMLYSVDLATLYGRAERTASRDSVLARIKVMPLVHPMDRVIRDAALARWAPPASR